MNNKNAAIQGLLDSLEWLENDLFLNSGDVAIQFTSWIAKVRPTLIACGLNDKVELWDQAMAGLQFHHSGNDNTLITQATGLRAVLLGILSNLNSNGELVPIEIFEGAPNYIMKLVDQANGCFTNGWYDGAAVMVRRILELLIIDCFEKKDIEDKIKNSSEEYLYLSELIPKFLDESSWHIPRNARSSLPKLKEIKKIGDLAAHGKQIVTKTHLNRFAKDILFSLQAIVQIAEY